MKQPPINATMENVTQHRLSRKDMLMAAILMRPGQDFAMLGSWTDPQILMDLSGKELAYVLRTIQALQPALEAMSEQLLISLLNQKMHLMGDPLSALFGPTDEP